MRAHVRAGAIVWLSLLAGVEPALGDSCTRVPAGEGAELQKYANACFERLGVDPAEFAKTFNCVDPDVAKPLKVEVDGDAKMTCFETRDGPCEWAKDTQELKNTFPKCDYSAWLSDRCYGDSYIQVIKTQNSDVKGALLCRHKTSFSGAFDDFDDVAMIVHNSKNGETCWFQSETGEGVKLKGQDVPGPVCEGADKDFWLTPNESMGIKCIQCHDSGPWMNSRWMRRTTQELGIPYDEESSPYLNSTPPFDQWPMPLFVKYGEHLAGGDPGCTDCHKIAAARPDFRTCDVWIKRATGQGDSALLDVLTDTGKKDHNLYWMPDPEDGSTWTKASWEAKYQKHVAGLIDCCKAVGNGSSGLPKGCTAYCPDRPDGKCPTDRWTH